MLQSRFTLTVFTIFNVTVLWCNKFIKCDFLLQVVSMKYTVNQAAKILGKTRQTVYRHIESKPISVVKDDDGNQLIEASELIRVYGNDINFDALNSNKPNTVTSKKLHDVTAKESNVTESIEDKIQLVKLQAQVENLKSQIENKEEETAYVKQLLEEEKAERKASNNLLEDHRAKENRWDKQFKSLEQRIANQEKHHQETEEKYKKTLRQAKGLKKALDTEKNKSFFKKLFG